MTKQPSHMDIATGKRISFLRKHVVADVRSQEEFAKKLGVTRGAVGNWELGKGISRENLQKIALTFNASFEWLATGTGSPKSKPSSYEERVNRLKLRRPELGAAAEAAIEGTLRSMEERDEETTQ